MLTLQKLRTTKFFMTNMTFNSANVSDIIENFERIGKLPNDFDMSSIMPLLEHPNEKVRILAVKTLGKAKSLNFLDKLYNMVSNDPSTMVKREAVSSIGRLRDENAIETLIEILNNNDPKIVCQAIRGLLVFKGYYNVDNALKPLLSHENEMVSSIIKKEYFSTNNNPKRQIQRHTEVYPFLRNVVVNGDVLKVLESVPDESIHLTFTSPPYYNARDYSIYPSYEAYLKFLEKVFEATFRITKEGRFLVVNTSPVIVPRISRAHSSKRYPIPFDLNTILTRMGWEFIDDIIWMKPEYSVKNRVGGFQQHRKPLAYKPNNVTEYLMVYRKNTTKLIDWNIHQYTNDIVEQSKVLDGFETTNVWQICPRSDKVHSAVFPAELCKRVIEYYSFKGDLIFDPFGGSGTLGRTARALGRYCFLTEIEPTYFEYMKTFETNRFEGLGSQPVKFLSIDEFQNSIDI